MFGELQRNAGPVTAQFSGSGRKLECLQSDSGRNRVDSAAGDINAELPAVDLEGTYRTVAGQRH